MNPMEYVSPEPYKLYIDGQYVPAEKGNMVDVINAANNQPFAKVYRGTKEDCEKAIRAARKAFDEGPWSKMSAKDRSKLLLKAARIPERRAEEFSVIETLECGKNYGSCRYWEAPMAVDAFEFFAGKARHLDGKVVPTEYGTLNYVTWNPCGRGERGNGFRRRGGQLSGGERPGGHGIHDGRHRHRPGDHRPLAKLVKDIALQLGGKSPNIFFEDVDIQQAARFAVYGFTNHAGQICVSGTRILVQRNIYDRFLEAMVAAAGRLVPGDGFDPKANLNTLISKEHAATVWDYIESGKREGARLLCGGAPYTEGPLAQGNFVPVTIFADVTPEMTIFQEEIFGPVGCVTPFGTEEEAVALANGTTYGLAGGVFTRDIKRALRVADKIKSGQIYVNNYFSKGMIESPGTGWKESGLGVAGIHKYMISKTVFLETIDDVLPPV